MSPARRPAAIAGISIIGLLTGTCTAPRKAASALPP
jgi:hypothetical protein